MILVTGGMGFIGMHVVKALLDAGESVVPTSHRSWRTPEIWGDVVGTRVQPENLDVASTHDAVGLAVKHKVSAVVHLAMPPIAGNNPSAEYITSMQGLINMLEAAKTAGAQRFVFASSNSVYGGLAAGPLYEDTLLPIASNSQINAFKKASEVLMMNWADRTGMSVAAVRPPGVFGPLYYSLYNMAGRFCHAAVKGVEANYPPSGIPYADSNADLAYVTDVAQVFARATLQPKLPHRIYNAGAGVLFTNGQLEAAVKRVVPAAKVATLPGAHPNPGPPNFYLDMARVKADLGYTPQYDLDRGVAEYIDWLRTHPL